MRFAAVPLLALAATSAQAVVYSVVIFGGNFNNGDVSIQPGDSVFWTWTGAAHSVTQGTDCKPAQGGFDSGSRNFGTYQQTFNAPGIYNFFSRNGCMRHTVRVGNSNVNDPNTSGGGTTSSSSSSSGSGSSSSNSNSSASSSNSSSGSSSATPSSSGSDASPTSSGSDPAATSDGSSPSGSNNGKKDSGSSASSKSKSGGNGSTAVSAGAVAPIAVAGAALLAVHALF
ncbi:hypothetical protein GQ42DRAFT_170744 [Ramicandelaber brevisporus]|nr:hypothetical protein GQ42DRAFT_170744 [Ramicandelaber brevisporus]